MATRVSSPVFVGRQAELEGFERALARSRGERARSVLLLSGEAGVGKTRFVTELIGRLPGDVALLKGSGVDLGEASIPYAPIAEALRGLLAGIAERERDELIGAGRPDLARLLPALGRVRETPTIAGINGPSARARLFESVLALIGRLAVRHPVVVFVDDLHWSDRSTLDLITFLAHNVSDVPVAFLLAYRSDELHRRHLLVPFLAEFGRRAAERVELRRLNRDELAAQLAGILGRPPAAALVERILSRSEGNPYFAEELLAADRPGSDLPLTLRDVLDARLANLSEEARHLLGIAAASGASVGARLLAMVADQEDAKHLGALRELIERHILVADSLGRDDGYRFRHALAREAAYAELLPAEKTRIHRRLAEALTADTGATIELDSAAQIAHNWQAAHDQRRALEWSVKAGRAAEDTYAFPEALYQYERALELWEQVPEPAGSAGLDQVELLERAAAAASVTDPSRAVGLIQTAIGRVDDGAEPSRAGVLYSRLGRYTWMTGDGAGAQAACRRAVALVPVDPPSLDRARVTAGLGHVLMIEGVFAESAAYCREAVAVARAVGERQIEGHALDSLGVDIAYSGDLDEGLALIDQARRIAIEIDAPEDVVRAQGNLADLNHSSGRFERAAEIARDGFDYAEERGVVHFYGASTVGEGILALYRLGRFSDAEQLIKRATRYELSGTTHIQMDLWQAAVDVARGEFSDARARLTGLGDLLSATVDPQWLGPLSEVRAELALWDGQADRAIAAIDEGMSLFDSMEPTPGQIGRIGPLLVVALRAQAMLADRARVAGGHRTMPDSPDRYLRPLEDLHAQFGARLSSFAALADAYLLLGRAESSRIGRASDPDLWRAAAGALGALDMGYMHAYAQWRQAEALLTARRQKSVAAALLSDAREWAREHGAVPLAQQIDALCTRARINPERPAEGLAEAKAAAFGLTPREQEVLALVAQGRSNRQIGENLFITEKTAGVHVSNILGKLGAAGRTEAAAIAQRSGLVGGRRAASH